MSWGLQLQKVERPPKLNGSFMQLLHQCTNALQCYKPPPRSALTQMLWRTRVGASPLFLPEGLQAHLLGLWRRALRIHS